MIEYKDVVKEYGTLCAVDRFCFRIETGEFFGLLGPNGAGKTTLMRMTAALTPVNSGRIEVEGKRVSRDDASLKRSFGIVPQETNLEADLTARENLEYHGRLYGLKKRERKERIKELLEFAGLEERADDTARTFSGGMQRRLMIIKALLHRPRILLLDEPTVGLDASARRKIWDVLRALNEKGLTIFMTTHYLEEAQTLCQRVGMMNEGRLVCLGSPEEIIRGLGRFTLEYFEGEETRQEFFATRKEATEKAAGLECGYRIRKVNLEDAFVTLTNRGLEG